jgi:hypothetical protein
VLSETHLDENSIKSVINEVQENLTMSAGSNVITIADERIESVSVTLSKLKMDNKLIDFR